MKIKEFKLANLAIHNRVTIYFIVGALILFGISQYNSTPKESMPEVDFPFYMVNTIYPGTAAADMENLVTRHIETELMSISGIESLNSQSLQDFSSIFIEFEPGMDETETYLDVQKAVDKARSKLPNDLLDEPDISRLEISEFPILNINLSGDVSLPVLKKYADDLQEQIEGLTEVTRVDIVGALEREIQVNVDLYKMQATGLSFFEIENAIRGENVNISGGQYETDGLKVNLRVWGEFQRVDQIANVIVKDGVYLRDVANVVDDFEDRESYSRLNGSDVVTLNVIKKGGENLIIAVEKIQEMLDEFEKTASPGLLITKTGDFSVRTQHSVDNLFNTMLLGFAVVVLVLMFFMGAQNALFAGMAIPLSMLIAFILVPIIGYTMNTVVMIALILVLGILVDNSIVVVENIYRHYSQGLAPNILQASKQAVGEVAMPVLGGTLTTMAPFVPLLFWPGIIGSFIIFVPVMVLITLAASILVAYTMNPVFAVTFMKKVSGKTTHKPKRVLRKRLIVAVVIAIICYIVKFYLLANLIVFTLLIFFLKHYVLDDLVQRFQEKGIPKLTGFYKRLLHGALTGRRLTLVLWSGVILLFLTIFTMALLPPKVVFMAQGDPDEINIFIRMPEGTHLEVTNAIAGEIEKRAHMVLGKDNPNVESMVVNVATNAGASFFDRSSQDRLARVGIVFIEYKDRSGPKTSSDYLHELREAVKGIPGAEIIVEASQYGPPTDKPINIEIQGDDINKLVSITQNLQAFIESSNIPGIERLQSNVEFSKREIAIRIDRDKANRLELSTSLIGGTLRTALFGSETSKFREGEDEYTIRVRLDKKYRSDIDVLLSQTLEAGGNNGEGPPKRIPLSAVVHVDEMTTVGSIVRKDNKRTITLSSNVLTGYNANRVVAQLRQALNRFDVEPGYSVEFTGMQSEQAEAGQFLSWALLVAMGLIMLIMVTQFNSIVKPLIIMTMIFFSYLGVFLCVSLFGVEFSILMSGMGLVAVGGVVATNGIILIAYTDQMMAEMADKKEAVVKAASTRLTPVLLTALSTVFGLLPLASGINIDWIGLFLRLEPNFFIGGPDAAFWNPLAMAIIFGLTIATFFTLIVEPAMYYMVFIRRPEKKRLKKS